MRVELLNYTDQWQAVKDAAMNTIGKESGSYPSHEWKRKMLLAEHSPIRRITFTFRFRDIPYYTVMHLVRHNIGANHFVSTQRTDRTGIDREKLPQGNLIDYTMDVNAQELIYISRKRLCAQASPKTMQAWYLALKAIAEVEPEIYSACVPECVYRGFCPEIMSCGYAISDEWFQRRDKYVKGE